MGHMIKINEFTFPLPKIFNPIFFPTNFALIQFILSTIVLFLGKKILFNGINSALHKNPNMNTLVAVGSLSSFIYSVVLTFLIPINSSEVHNLYFESSAMILTFIMTGKFLESRSTEKTKSAISALLTLTPDKVFVLPSTWKEGENFSNAKEIEIETENITVSEIDQELLHVSSDEKMKLLVGIIKNENPTSVIIFCNTKRSCEVVAKRLELNELKASFIIGDLPQNRRLKVLNDFKEGKINVLVATDVAARGIDISGLSHVVNYSLPFDGATYVHRIGRTGRAGSTGEAVTFVCPNEIRKLGFLQRAVRKASKGEMVESEIPSVDKVIEKKRTYLFDQLKQDLENQKSEEIPEQFVKMAQELYENDSAENVLASLLAVTYGKKLDKSRYGKIHAVNKGDSSDQLRLYIQLGRRDGYNPRRVADYFSSLLHIPGRLVDRIDISSNFTLVSLPKNMARKALELSKSNSKIPHMHIDVKEGGRRDFDFDDRSRKGGKNFGGKRRSESFSSERRNPKDADKNRSGKSKGNRPNFHTPTERSGSAGLYKKKSAKAERF